MARAIFGLDRAENGECMIEGKPIKVKNATGAIRAGLAMLTEDRKRYGVVLCRSIKENITLPHLKKYSNRFSLLKRKKETTDIATQMKLLNIKANSMNALTNSLSGGNQQKVVVAKWMVDKPKVLIMDEPTRGIDVGSKYEIYKLMCQLAAEGLGIIMISSELPEILGMSDRIIVMADGRIKGELTQEDATQVKIMSMSAGSN